jgi:glycerol-3-phosphate O-acyltransferase/dihydroxyacetone phosphate acyltransferase
VIRVPSNNDPRVRWRANPVVRWLAQAACWVFYRIDRIGDVPADGAALLMPNHPNSLLDPAIVWATAGRDVRFLAKSTLFAGALKPILAGAGAIPVYRKADQGVDTTRNAETFAAVSAALAAGDAVCIFPEGVSHSSGRLEPLRTGAARMALAAEHEGTPVQLVPIGLNFDRKTMFRSRVTVVYGAPFSGRDVLPTDNESDPAAVKALTERIASHMRRLLVEADPQADAVLVDRVDRLYAAARGRPADPAARLARRQAIATGMERLRRADPDRYEAVLLKLRRYDERLRRFGLRDRHLDWNVTTDDATRFALREAEYGIVLLPLCALGFVTFFIPYHVTGFLARKFTRHRDIVATAQVFTGAAVYAGWLAAIVAIVWHFFGSTSGLAMLMLLPLIAVVSLFAIERESAVIDAVRAWWLLRRAHAESRERLKRRRSELADVLDEVYRWLDLEAQPGDRAPQSN